MKPLLKTELELYLGELKQIYETTYDYFDKRKLGSKINGIEALLEVPKTNLITL